MTTSQRFLHTLRTPVGVAASIAFLALAFLAIFAPIIWGQQASVTNTSLISQPPSPEHVFGTDGSGRDILLRTLVATRLSVVMALTATAIGIVCGVVLGLLPLILGGTPGRWIVAGINIGVAFPGLLLAIAFSVILGQSAAAASLAIAIAMMPNYGRFVHNLAASVWGRDYVSAALVLGVPKRQIVFRHVLPNIRDPLLVNATLTAGGTLLAFAGLSFLGLGVQVPQFDWGRMLNEGISRIFVTPAAALVPGVAIILAGLTFVLLGEVLSRTLNTGARRTLSARVLRKLKRVRLRAAEDAKQDHATIDTGEASENVLSVRGLKVFAPGSDAELRPLVDGVSFDIGRGEIVGVVGESGSGKSLTLMSIAGLLEAPLHVTARSASFDGEDLVLSEDGHPRSLDHHFGTKLAMVFQDPMSSLNPALHVGTQVAESGQLHLDMTRAEAKATAVARLEDVRIPDAERRYSQYPHEYSGGMRQRAMIAAGLMGKPSLILADEPTTALDVTVQAGILKLLGQINEEDGTAIMFVSHDIAVVTSLCTRVLVMYRGRLVEDISADELRAGNAAHPYTQALMATVPTMSSPRGEAMASIPDDADFTGTSPIGVIEAVLPPTEAIRLIDFEGAAK
ncbi:dipeptide/oligopeptide/nickel ABC transporter permease/ATP-binding protein [Leucobacter aridicollis]|uniref:dipeptide/oligopeptide/nickel ABC transporter permease/ATP-binding protein n=1 Tax=Leucobacter aridicollis TaxID=283878 RepID=UPI0021079D6B|nr:dipeptide/oligopeptide/nickel ABC transporter permease/ATP-binding protein [Leucobacter aridicollis]UTX54190.1 dipeptide/oligopeptide/nickel ABC transporter permease/ATP-binding protein [Leucobacter aridicollis]